MAGIANGILSSWRTSFFCGNLLRFSDYVKPMARLSALMGIPQIFVLTHDSIGVGEDGPTHEPIEQLAMLRSTPNFMSVPSLRQTGNSGSLVLCTIQYGLPDSYRTE